MKRPVLQRAEDIRRHQKTSEDIRRQLKTPEILYIPAGTFPAAEKKNMFSYIKEEPVWKICRHWE